MTSPRRLTILADDLTGAADTGAPFAAAGFRTSVILAQQPPAEISEVLVINTNSRGLPADVAAHATRDAIHHLVASESGNSTGWVYKKIDSALRGHPRAEVEAAMDALGVQKVLVAPALPQQGRTTIRSRQHLHGLPLEETSFGPLGIDSNLLNVFDPHHTDQAISLPLETIRQGTDAIGRFLASISEGIIIADAETSTDLDALAQAIVSSDLKLIAGTAGLARSLAEVLPGPRDRAPLPVPQSATGGILVIAGSRDTATARQVDHLYEHGTPIVALATHHLDDPAMLQAEVITPLTDMLEPGDSVVLTTVGLHSPGHGAAEIRSHLASITAKLAGRHAVGGLVLTGGDVAMGVLEKLGVTHIDLGGEVSPAMPWGIAHLPNGTSIPIATKAGSFGTENALLACLLLLEGNIPVTRCPGSVRKP